MKLTEIADLIISYIKPISDKTSLEIIPAQQAIAHAVPSTILSTLDQHTVEKLESSLHEVFMDAIRPLTPDLRRNMVERAAIGFRAFYIDPKQAEEKANFVLRKLKEGGYDSFDRQFPFTQQLLSDLQLNPPDLHLRMRYSPNPIPVDDPDRNLEELKIEDLTPSQLLEFKNGNESEKEAMRAIDFGVQRATVLPDSSIGYLKITQFARPDFEETFQALDRAIHEIKDATSLVIDLRGNGGGCPDTVARLASYFFDEKILLNRLYQRSTDTTSEFYAEPEKVPIHFGQEKPIYILVDQDTFSAGEEFAYDLQSCKRATVIGQVTGGGAHPIRNFVIDDHFYLSIPYKKAINPYTHINWEGIGVLPDHLLSNGEDALAIARACIESPLISE